MQKERRQGKHEIRREPTEKVMEMLTRPYNDQRDGVIADPNGSYTGVCTPKNEVPVQDADDL